MSTPQENLTSILKTGGNIRNNTVKSKEANNSFTENFDFCEKSDNEKFFENLCVPLVKIESISLQPQQKSERFCDLLSSVYRNNDVKEELDEKIIANEETLETFEKKFIVDVKPTVIQQEPFLDIKDFDLHYNNQENCHVISKPLFDTKKKTISKKRLSEFFKSLCVLCDLCDDRRTERVIKLNRQEQIVAAVLLKKISDIGIKTKKIFPTKIPEQSCGRCFTKIILLYNRHKNKYAQRKIKKETGEVMDQTSHGYDCQCLTCQSQYGALPVLLKGIEEQDKMQSSQLQVSYQPDQSLDVPHQSQNLINLQPPINIDASQSQEQGSFQQYSSVKYEEECKSFQPRLPESYHHTFQSSTHDYGQFEMAENQMEVTFHPAKTEISLDQTSSDFGQPRLNIRDQSQFDVSFQSQPQYYDPKANVSDIQNLAESVSCPQAQHLPTLLQELENRCRTDLDSQPSTSSGIHSHQAHPQEDKQSKKVMTCMHCEKSFTHKGDFNKHLRKHTKEKPYKCSFCDKMFSHTSNLHRHQRIHSGDRPFKCQYCDKCFNRKDKLESHKNSKFCKNKRNWK